jgi:hypothetical protein
MNKILSLNFDLILVQGLFWKKKLRGTTSSLVLREKAAAQLKTKKNSGVLGSYYGYKEPSG